MNVSRQAVVRTLGEFIGFLVILVGGALVAVYGADQFAPPASDVVRGLALVAIAAAGVWWLRVVGPDTEQGRQSALAGLGGGVGFLAFDLLLTGERHAAVGAALGAAAFAAVGILYSRRRA